MAAQADNPCAQPALQTLELELGVARKTPWNLEVTYAVDDDRKLGTGFMFFLHQGERRWETRRDSHNWTKPMMWRGFCWRGADRPASRAKQVKIQVAPLCQAGQLLQAGKCDAALAQ